MTSEDRRDLAYPFRVANDATGLLVLFPEGKLRLRMNRIAVVYEWGPGCTPGLTAVSIP